MRPPVTEFQLKASDLDVEWQQCLDEGRKIESLAEEFGRVKSMELASPGGQAAARALLDRCGTLPMKADFAFVEPSELQAIRRECQAGPAWPTLTLAPENLPDKVFGGWAGRCAGCLLGKPVEGWSCRRLREFLENTGQWPLTAYLEAPEDDTLLEKFQIPAGAPFIDRVGQMPEDDDLNYTVLALELMTEHETDFTPDDVACNWLRRLPVLRTFTAERVALRNFCNGLAPPRSATVRNPYREWIGAQIRADFYGYASPGMPRQGADLAWRDACTSHVRNGIYGSMWVAAMVAGAFVVSDVTAIVEIGLAHVPQHSRLSRHLRQVLAWYREGLDADYAVERIHRMWNEEKGHHWCHTISNAMIVATGLLWGELDFGRSVCLAVGAGFDTDCNGATVGSILGVVLGAGQLPPEWVKPLNGKLTTGVVGYPEVHLGELVEATLKVISRTIR